MEDKKLSIGEHLGELRGRLIKAVGAWFVATAITAIFTFPILRFLTQPAKGTELVYIDPTELITTYFKVAILGGFVLAMPVILYQVVMFVAPGLTPKERRYLYTTLPAVTIAFIVGAVFCWFLLLPPALKFLLSFGSDIAEPQIRISRYVNLVLLLPFWMGISFQTPFLMFILARIGAVKPRTFAKNRKLAVVGAFILAAIITPTFDPINQTLVAIPLIVLYEFGVWMSKLASRRRKAAITKASGATELEH